MSLLYLTAPGLPSHRGQCSYLTRTLKKNLSPEHKRDLFCLGNYTAPNQTHSVQDIVNGIDFKYGLFNSILCPQLSNSIDNIALEQCKE